MSILLHKERLTPLQIKRLAFQGVVAIQTEHPEDFHILGNGAGSEIAMNDTIWACLDALDGESSKAPVLRRQFVRNMAQIAREERQKRDAVEKRTQPEDGKQ
jgi:hypothetical protein